MKNLNIVYFKANASELSEPDYHCVLSIDISIPFTSSIYSVLSDFGMISFPNVFKS